MLASACDIRCANGAGVLDVAVESCLIETASTATGAVVAIGDGGGGGGIIVEAESTVLLSVRSGAIFICTTTETDEGREREKHTEIIEW